MLQKILCGALLATLFFMKYNTRISKAKKKKKSGKYFCLKFAGSNPIFGKRLNSVSGKDL
jgi:hypothetical protein